MNIFTDGSTLNNQCAENRVGGMGVFFGDNDIRNISEPMKKNATNQRTELKACILALNKCNSEETINIYTDSKYVIGCMTEWINNWIKNDWKKSDGKKIKNLDLIKELYSLVKSKNIIFYHVKAHQKKPSDPKQYDIWYGNMMADKLATTAAKLT